MLNAHIITLFPEAIAPYLKSSILGRAQKAGKLAVSLHDPREHAEGKWVKRPGGKRFFLKDRIDSRPYGGGPGMVIEALPVLAAVREAVGRKKGVEYIFFSPSGEQLTNALAEEFAKSKRLVLISGHYEGVDARVKDALNAREVSIGPYTLTGGELPALVLLDAVARRIPGVLGNAASLEETRTAAKDVYTRPESFRFGGKQFSVPEVLRSGDHRAIEAFKKGRR